MQDLQYKPYYPRNGGSKKFDNEMEPMVTGCECIYNKVFCDLTRRAESQGKGKWSMKWKRPLGIKDTRESSGKEKQNQMETPISRV